MEHVANLRMRSLTKAYCVEMLQPLLTQGQGCKEHKEAQNQSHGE